jgi:HEAT repeat protein
MARSIRNLLQRIRNRDLKATIELLEIKDPNIIRELFDALSDENEYVRSYASIALSCYCMPEVESALIKLLQKSPNLLARTKAIDTLILMKSKSALPEILKLVNDPNPVMQISINRAKKMLS